MEIKKLVIACLCSVVMLGTFSCGSKTGSSAEKSSEEFEKVEDEASELHEQIQEVIYNIPSPSEIPFLLESTGAEFNQSLINGHDKADQYTSGNDNASLNLGIYASDIGYLVSYQKAQEALTYLGSTKKLADGVGITGSFDPTIIERFEKNLSHRDSMAYILDATINKTSEYLKNDDRDKLAALIVTGSFVEGLYISTQLIQSYPKDILSDDDRQLVLVRLMRVVLQQEKSVNDLIGLLSQVEQTQPITDLVSGLKELKQKYESLEIEDQIKNNRGDLILTDTTLGEITAQVASIREGIVG